MEFIVKNIECSIEASKDEAFLKAIKTAGINKKNINKLSIYKKSVDARGGKVKFIYSVCIDADVYRIPNNKDISVLERKEYKINIGKARMEKRPIIIGFGPAGLFSAYLLSLYGYKPIIFEKGSEMSKRTVDVENFFKNGIFNSDSNVQFGEGGAGTFSDGKLTTRINDFRCSYVLEIFHKFGADESILYESHPHIGTDKLKNIIINMRKEIIKNGATVNFDCEVKDIISKNGSVCKVRLKDGREFDSENVILAVGHSARYVYKMLYDKEVYMEQKPFSVGFRIEHKREFINKGRYKKYFDNPALGAAEYQFSYRENERGCYTFCMCPGGSVIAASSEENSVTVNGMSENSRNMENSNSAVVVSVLPYDFGNDLFSGMNFQREIERKAFDISGRNYYAPVQLSKDFVNGEKTIKLSTVKPSYPIGYEICDLKNIFPESINKLMRNGLMAFDKKIKGFSTTDGVLTGVETRTSAPLRIKRGEDYQSVSLKGLYPAGEGAGYAGGITSAAVDGLKVAEKIIEKFRPFY